MPTEIAKEKLARLVADWFVARQKIERQIRFEKAEKDSKLRREMLADYFILDKALIGEMPIEKVDQLFGALQAYYAGEYEVFLKDFEKKFDIKIV